MASAPMQVCAAPSGDTADRRGIIVIIPLLQGGRDRPLRGRLLRDRLFLLVAARVEVVVSEMAYAPTAIAAPR